MYSHTLMLSFFLSYYRLESKLMSLNMELADKQEDIEFEKVQIEMKTNKIKELESLLHQSQKNNKRLEKELKGMERKLKLLEFQRSTIPSSSTPAPALVPPSIAPSAVPIAATNAHVPSSPAPAVSPVPAVVPILLPSMPGVMATPMKSDGINSRDRSGESTPREGSVTGAPSRVRTYSGAEAAAKILALTTPRKARVELEREASVSAPVTSDSDKDKTEIEIQTEPLTEEERERERERERENDELHSRSMDAEVEVEDQDLEPLTDRVVLTMEVRTISSMNCVDVTHSLSIGIRYNI